MMFGLGALMLYAYVYNRRAARGEEPPVDTLGHVEAKSLGITVQDRQWADAGT